MKYFWVCPQSLAETSLLLWERGLKFPGLLDDAGRVSVAPLVGAWIEMALQRLTGAGKAVAPLVGAWIEILCHLLTVQVDDVAPLVGAWIEIAAHCSYPAGHLVAPLVGAWIEIPTDTVSPLTLTRRSSCGSVD